MPQKKTNDRADSAAAANEGLLLVVSGPAGAGKSTLCQRLVADSGGRAAISISATTRGPRRGEVDGTHYFFISREQFEREAKDGQFAEYAEVAGELYGTPRKFLDEQLAAGIDVLLDIDVQGCESVRKLYGPRAVAAFVLPPSRAVLESRLRGRATDSEEKIQRRLKLAEREIARAGEYDYLVINDRQEQATADLAAILRAEHSRLTREGSRASWALKMWS